MIYITPTKINNLSIKFKGENPISENSEQNTITSLDLSPQNVIGRSIIKPNENKPLTVEEVEEKYPNRFLDIDKISLVKMSKEDGKFIREILGDKHTYRGKENVYRFNYEQIEDMYNAHKEAPEFIEAIIKMKANNDKEDMYRFSPTELSLAYDEYQKDPEFAQEVYFMKNKDGSYRFNWNISSLREAKEKHPKTFNKILYTKDNENEYRFTGSDVHDLIMPLNYNENLTNKLIDLNTKNTNRIEVPKFTSADIINILFKINYNLFQPAEKLFDIKNPDGTYPFDFADLKYISKFDYKENQTFEKLLANPDIHKDNITAIIASTTDNNRDFASELYNNKNLPQEKIIPTLLRCETKSDVEKMRNLLYQNKLEEYIDHEIKADKKPEGASLHGKKIPRYIYHLTTKSAYLSMLKDKEINKYKDGFDLTENGVFAVEMPNLFKRWRKSSDWGNIILQEALLNATNKNEGNLVILRIPTRTLDYDKMLIRNQNELFRYDMQDDLNIHKHPQIKGEHAIEKAKLIKRRKQAIEYIYTDNIPIKYAEKIGEANLNTIKYSKDYNSEKPVRSTFIELLKGTPESKGAEFLDY